MPQSRAHARQQFPGAEGLGYIIVRSQLEQQNLVRDVAGCAQHNDRQSRSLGLYLLAQIAAGKFGQAQVENNNGRGGGLKALQRRLPVGLNLNRVSLGFEQPL